ncbi:hypothetical protein ACI78Q_08870 [Geodermatophilus sp. SYSU D00705]
MVEDGGRRRLLEHVPDGVLLTPAGVAAAADRLATARVVSLQLQRPGPAVRAALERVSPGAVVVTDGAPEDDASRTAVLARADVVRADAAEAELLTGRPLDGVAPEDAAWAAAAAAALTVVHAGGWTCARTRWRTSCAGPGRPEPSRDEPRCRRG